MPAVVDLNSACRSDASQAFAGSTKADAAARIDAAFAGAVTKSIRQQNGRSGAAAVAVAKVE